MDNISKAVGGAIGNMALGFLSLIIVGLMSYALHTLVDHSSDIASIKADVHNLVVMVQSANEEDRADRNRLQAELSHHEDQDEQNLRDMLKKR